MYKDNAEVLGTHAANPVLGKQQRKEYKGTIITRIKGRKKTQKFRDIQPQIRARITSTVSLTKTDDESIPDGGC